MQTARYLRLLIRKLNNIHRQTQAEIRHLPRADLRALKEVRMEEVRMDEASTGDVRMEEASTEEVKIVEVMSHTKLHKAGRQLQVLGIERVRNRSMSLRLFEN